MSEKQRLDILLFERGLCESREKAKTTIMSGQVFINGQRYDKPGVSVPVDVEIEVKSNPIPYVSRGGLKLEKAIKEFDIELDGKICIDIGASTGGFTDCMLQNGAVKVYSVDVGYGQLAYKLRCDERVVCMERTNIRLATPEMFDDEFDFVSIDVSFISLKLVLPVVRKIIKECGKVVCLIKPQFEAGREFVGKKGVVRDPEVHLKVLYDFLENARQSDFKVLNMSFSPIKGPEGNIEYLAYLSPNFEEGYKDVSEIVSKAHYHLDK